MIEPLFYLTIIFDFIGIILFILVIKFLINFKKYEKKLKEFRIDLENRINVLQVFNKDDITIRLKKLETNYDKIEKSLSVNSTSLSVTLSGIREKIMLAIEGLREGLEALNLKIKVIEEKQGDLNNWKEKVKK